ASSRVGTNTSAAMPVVGCVASRSMTGTRKASVLPVPVCAVAMTSLPAKACGMAAACTGVGIENPAALSRSFREGVTESSEKLFILLSCRRDRAIPTQKMQVSAAISNAGLFLDYAEDERRKRRAGILRSSELTRGTALHNRSIKRTNSVSHILRSSLTLRATGSGVIWD